MTRQVLEWREHSNTWALNIGDGAAYVVAHCPWCGDRLPVLAAEVAGYGTPQDAAAAGATLRAAGVGSSAVSYTLAQLAETVVQQRDNALKQRDWEREQKRAAHEANADLDKARAAEKARGDALEASCRSVAAERNEALQQRDHYKERAEKCDLEVRRLVAENDAIRKDADEDVESPSAELARLRSRVAELECAYASIKEVHKGSEQTCLDERANRLLADAESRRLQCELSQSRKAVELLTAKLEHASRVEAAARRWSPVAAALDAKPDPTKTMLPSDMKLKVQVDPEHKARLEEYWQSLGNMDVRLRHARLRDAARKLVNFVNSGPWWCHDVRLDNTPEWKELQVAVETGGAVDSDWPKLRLRETAEAALEVLKHYKRQLEASFSCDERGGDGCHDARVAMHNLICAIERRHP